MSNCLIAQSGGPTVAINASLSGVIQSAIDNDQITTVYGSLNGIQGVLNNNIVNLSDIFTGNPDKIETLRNTPAMYLGSCRYKLKKDGSEYKSIFEFFKQYDIKYFFYIGGNDSMDTVLKLSQYANENDHDVKVMGVPKTVDNDLFGTDHTPGFGSAAKYVATSMLEIAHDTYIYDIPSVTIVEIMGRNAGWLTAASALARNEYNNSPDLIYLPEVSFSVDEFIKDIKRVQATKKNVIVAVSEGIKNKNGEYISASEDSGHDAFGHSKLSGTAKTLENIISEKLNCKVRSIEFNVLQRSAMHIASLTDNTESFEVGYKAVDYAVNGETGKMMIIKRISENPYKHDIDCFDITEVANKEKTIPRNWINESGNDVTEDLINYMRPLIVGEPTIKYEENGLPSYLNITHLIK